MQVIFTARANRELAEATLYYEGQEKGLGQTLMEEFDAFIQIISVAPDRPRMRPRGYRRVNLKRFPYYIAYSIESGAIVVLAFGHSARKPDYWTVP